IDINSVLSGGTGSISTLLLAQCENAATGHSFGVDAHAVYAACTGVDLAAVHQPDTAQGVYTVPLDEHGAMNNAAIKFFPVPGGYLHGGAAFDAKSGRMA